MKTRSGSEPFLTIGMATIDDFDGVYFTITSLLIHHADVLKECEIVVVDNNPDSKQGRLVKDWIHKHVANGRYFPFDGHRGTAAPRNEVFRRARGQAVLCLDCHVLLAPGAVTKLIEYYRRNPSCCDLLSGPLIDDSGRVAATHQRPKWRAGAWGVWAIDERGTDPAGEPFEVWQQGMGLFSCRKEAWVGFHPDFRGFGGCESYIMEKFRRRGARVLCCPWLRWTHRFQRARDVPYDVDSRDRIQNYLIGFRELGLNIQPVLNHFGVSRDDADPTVKHGPDGSNRIAVIGALTHGGVKMRGRALARHLSCDLIASQEVPGMGRCRTIVAIKGVQCPKETRASCDRLIYDPLDAFSSLKRGVDVDPVGYWKDLYDLIRFDDVIATSPACLHTMRQALPSDVGVHLIPHQCDPRIRPSWRNPDGPIVYSGLSQFIESGKDRIEEACRRIGRPFVIGSGCEVLEGASLALALRLPPYDTRLFRCCKPQIKLENAAAAGLPVVATDCPAARSLHPEIHTVPVDFSVKQLVLAMRAALEGPGLSRPFDDAQYLAAMDRLLQQERKKVVVYTAIFGGYDELIDPPERIPGAEYVCFTDNERLKSAAWNIRYCKPIGDPLLQSKKIKILAHEALDCEVSLWVDGRVELSNFGRSIDRLETDLGLIRHPVRNCIYDEANYCRTIGRGDPARIAEAVARYRSQGHPPDYGLWMGGVILRRHTQAVAAFNQEWWREVSTGTTRDQLSLPVVLRRLQIPVQNLPRETLVRQVRDHAKMRPAKLRAPVVRSAESAPASVRCSVIIAVLDSHEIFRRQMLHLNRILPDGFELIVIDDGSDVPLTYDHPVRFPFRILYSNDKRPWTQHKARNMGASAARGEYLLMTDIDHVLTSDAISDVERFGGDMMRFSRQVAHLDERGMLCNVGEVKNSHVNTFVIRKNLYQEIGGYRESVGEYGTDRELRAGYQRLVDQGAAEPVRLGKTIHVITDATWFHKLPRISNKK